MGKGEPVDNKNNPANDVVGGENLNNIFDCLESVDCDDELDLTWNPNDENLLGPIPNMLSELYSEPPVHSTAEESSAAQSHIPVSNECDNSHPSTKKSFPKITETPIPSRARSKLARQPSGKWNSFNSPSASKSCSHCGVTETPQWRFGPDGDKTLCNACGIRFKKDGLFPEYLPASSPAFDDKIHSNSLRKVIQMRKEKDTEKKDRGDSENLNS